MSFRFSYFADLEIIRHECFKFTLSFRSLGLQTLNRAKVRTVYARSSLSGVVCTWLQKPPDNFSMGVHPILFSADGTLPRLSVKRTLVG